MGTFAVVYTETTKKVAYYEADSVEQAKFKFDNGKAKIEEYEDEHDVSEAQEIYEV
jgi:hypothetical protein